MVDVLSVATNVLMLGALYSLIAIGFTLIFGVGGVLNLSHGATITVGAYSAYAVEAASGSILLGALAAAVVGGAFSLGLYKGLISKVRHNPVTVLILTLVVAIIVEQLALVVFGGQDLSVRSIIDGSVVILGDSIQINRILVFVLSWVLIGGLFYFVNRTRTGKAILATSMSDKGAALAGIDSEQVYTYTWVLAGALAGLAGLFLASFQTANPLMGRNPLLLSFAIVVLGGLGSIRGSVIGAYLISFLDQMTIQFLSERLAGVSALVVLVLVLLIRPKGLFGRELVEE
ncbi:branched-chain amino acid ABC transporter permease [Natronomonas gomsonensis]|uniref:branched-chain amino acid ABC transporter permease n=1 Tax=Natronomonas gomsonensis TaxID=1046043 RepID=UPI0015BD8220|nr:branched-chain amino acid ABC transporter permease [Natronomonas gomsonensis]